MALDQAGNFDRIAAAESIDSTQTTINVDNASELSDPSNGEYNVVVWNAGTYTRPDQDPNVEIMRVTAYDTGNDTITVTRGQENTSGQSHPDGSAIQNSPTAKMFSDIASRYVAEGEDFDGQSTSEFTNLQSVSTDEVTIASGGRMAVDNTAGLQFDTFSLPDGSKRELLSDDNDPTGILWVIDRSSAVAGLFLIQGAINQAVEEIDSQGSFSTTEDNSDTVNIYWDSTNSRYEIGNQISGTDRDLTIYFVGSVAQ